MNDTTSDQILWDVRLSSLRFPCVSASVELGLIRSLKDGGLSTSQLAQSIGCTELAVEVLLNVLWADGFVEMRDQNFSLSDVSRRYLLEESPYYWGNVFKTSGENPEHERVMSAVRKDGERLKFGSHSYTEMWEQGKITEEAATAFTARMHNYIFAPAVGAVESGAFEGVNHLLDAGGGAGTFGIALAKRYRGIQVTLFDLEPVCNAAREYVSRFGVDKNFSYFPGSFFDEFPRGHDAVLFSNVFHDWRREHCEKMTKNAFNSLGTGGRIIVHEMVLDKNKRPEMAKACFGLLMYLNHSGKQYSIQELTEILERAGFRDIQTVPTFGYYSVASGRKP